MAIQDYSMMWQPTIELALTAAEKDFGEQTLFPQHVEIADCTNFGEMQAYETDVMLKRAGQETIEDRLVMINASLLEKLGIINDIHDTAKAQTWLESDEGSKWLGYYIMAKESNRKTARS